MDTATFEHLLAKVAPLIQRQNTHLRDPISPSERLSLFLRHIATGKKAENITNGYLEVKVILFLFVFSGETQVSLSMSFRLGQSTISGIVREMSAALVTVLKDDFLRFPSSEEEWKVVANDFGERWNFFNCLGAMDGKHVLIDPPVQSGSTYHNYKGTFSIVLLALLDAQLRFIYIDVGTNGRISDGGIWNKCSLKAKLETNSIKRPPPAPLPGTETPFPFVILGDEGFALTQYVLIPYPGSLCANRKDRRIFNCR